MHTLYVNIASNKIVPLAASRCTTGKWLSFVPLTYLELLCSLAIANVSQQEHTVWIRVVFNSFPDLQVLVVRIGRLAGRPSNVLPETDVPYSAEADLTEPFRAFVNRALLIVLRRRS